MRISEARINGIDLNGMSRRIASISVTSVHYSQMLIFGDSVVWMKMIVYLGERNADDTFFLLVLSFNIYTFFITTSYLTNARYQVATTTTAQHTTTTQGENSNFNIR
jgi:hypothetical protein